jgi:ABC-type transport system involved in multi-copper enzyme maturation permease subunit
LLIGPVFTRELVITPRRTRVYIARTAYVLALLTLICTAWLVLTGTQLIRDVGDMARFGASLFQILAPIQLALGVFFSAMLAASAVAQEKDRQTLTLLLLTNLSNNELVVGGLLASLLNVLVLLGAALPLFMLTALFGGIEFAQIGQVFAVTLGSVFVCGSLGSTLALWREKTFQALAMTVLILVLWLGVGEILAAGLLGQQLWGFSCRHLAIAISPWQAILAASRPQLHSAATSLWANPVHVHVAVALAITVVLNGLGTAMIRVWNGSREAPRSDAAEEAAGTAGGNVHSAGGRTRHVWDNPILWREVATWAYGRKIVIIRVVYVAIFAAVAVYLHQLVQQSEIVSRTSLSAALIPLLLLSLILVNAQAVTSLTSERDVRALDLLLVTDLSAKELVFGKLGGIFYNTKEMVALPMLLGGYLWWAGAIDLENLFYVLGGLAILYVFAAMLGVHAGITYANSRTAVAVSLGTMFFLFLGVATCLRMMVAFSGSFQAQLHPFLVFMIGGGLGLFGALGARNPSTAIGVASFMCPFATFYAIASFLMEHTLPVFLVMSVAYGFTTAAMLIPAIYEFDVATGRTTLGEE